MFTSSPFNLKTSGSNVIFLHLLSMGFTFSQFFSGFFFMSTHYLYASLYGSFTMKN